jgi:hypothetical protein
MEVRAYCAKRHWYYSIAGLVELDWVARRRRTMNRGIPEEAAAILHQQLTRDLSVTPGPLGKLAWNITSPSFDSLMTPGRSDWSVFSTVILSICTELSPRVLRGGINRITVALKLETVYPCCLDTPRVNGTTAALKRATPRLVYERSNAVNYAYLRSIGIMLGQNLVRDYTDSTIVALGKRLAAVLEKPDTGFEGDVRESNEWAAMLGIGDWFDWQAFEDVPESYLGSL